MWPEAEQTQVLLNKAADGDAAAVNGLLERHREAVRRLIALRMDRRMLRRLDASDIVQDVLVEAAARLREYLADPRLPFHLWLRGLAQDRMIDLHRRHRAHKRDVLREQPPAGRERLDRSSFALAAQLVAAGPTPAAAAIRAELEERFWRSLERLDEADREIILMRHAEHLGNSEVAAALGLSPAAAGMRYLRAMRRLRGELGGEGGEE